jgi:hypothetical protein
MTPVPAGASIAGTPLITVKGHPISANYVCLSTGQPSLGWLANVM